MSSTIQIFILLLIIIKCRKVEPKITSMEGFNPERGNKSKFNDRPNIPVKIGIIMHDTLFSNSFFSTTTNSKKYDIVHKKHEVVKLSTNLYKYY